MLGGRGAKASRVALAALVALACLSAFGCEHEGMSKLSPPGARARAPASAAMLPAVQQQVVVPEYTLPPWIGSGAGSHSLQLDGDARGALVQGRRVVQMGGTVRADADVTGAPLLAVDAVPSFLGGGFLFRSRTALFLADTFDGPLRPIVTVPVEIYAVSFGPRSALVRGNDGERWSIDLKTGDRVPFTPAGLVDVAALADGRAVAITEGGGAFVSVDRGARWVDVTRELTASPATVFAKPDDTLWMTQSSGPAIRVDPGGKLARVDSAPSGGPAPPRTDPRWHGAQPPLAVVLRSGVPIDATTAVVVVDGDVVRVSLVNGAIVSISPGRLPPEDNCEGLRTPNDVLFICRGHSGSAYVVSHLLSDKAPVIETSFLAAGRMYASDDGALAFAGPCTRAKPSPYVACVRATSGVWRELDLETIAPDGGAAAPSVAAFGDGVVVRWVPRADGSAVAIVDGKTPGWLDPTTGEAHPWRKDAMPSEVKVLLSQSAQSAQAGRNRGSSEPLVDRTWTLNEAGTLRAWTAAGGSLSIDQEGRAALSPFHANRVSLVGPLGLGVSHGERVWQSVDHGQSWVEVGAPLVGRNGGIQLQACSLVGCDLGAWYRLGWRVSAPSPEAPPAVVPDPARVARPPLPELSCRPASETHAVSLPKSDRSPEDFGPGAMRLPVSASDNQVRILFDRHGANPVHSSNGSSVASDYTAPRLVLYGPAFDPEHGTADVRRQLAFVAPFDSGASVRKTSFSVSELVGRGRALGMRMQDILGSDPTAVTGVTPVTSLDPSGTGDVVFLGATGAVAVVRATPTGKTTQRVAMHARGGDAPEPVSAVATSADEVAILALDSAGSGVVYRLGPLGVTEVFEAPAPPSPQMYPANADALALGPGGELALVRTASGGDPPTTGDPAILLVAGAPPVVLAPWSTLTSAADEACKADTTGYRLTVHTVAPWIRLVGEMPEPDDDAPMLARVRWSDKRVCLEAVELRAADTSMGGDMQIETWLVAHLTAPASAGRVSVVPGTESRQAMSCSLSRPK